MKGERNELLTCTQNNTTSAYKKTGLYPLNPNCEAWTNILETMEPLKKRYKETANCENIKNYEIIRTKQKVILTKQEKKTLTQGLPADTHHLQAAYFHMRRTLGNWRRELLFDSSINPTPKTPQQIISTRLFSFSVTQDVVADLKKSLSRRKRNDTKKKEELGKQIINCTPITHLVPLMYSYLIPSESGTSCEDVRIEGHAVRTGANSFVVYLKDSRPGFNVTSDELLNPDKFSVTRPQLVVSSDDKRLIARRMMRESKRREVLRVRARKEEAKLARDKWIELQFQNMKENVKKDNYTFSDFKNLLQQAASPFKHRSGDGYVTEINDNESVCLNEMALNTIDGVLQKKRQQEELARINALEKWRKSKKWK